MRSPGAWEREVHWGPVAWRPMPIPSRPQQIGLWGEAILSQVPSRVDGIQRSCGVAGLYPRETIAERIQEGSGRAAASPATPAASKPRRLKA